MPTKSQIMEVLEAHKMIQHIDNAFAYRCECGAKLDGTNDAWRSKGAHRDHLAEVLAALDGEGWIACAERLPEDNDTVLAWCVNQPEIDKDGEQLEATYTGIWRSQYHSQYEGSVRAWKYVTHWKEIVPPPPSPVENTKGTEK